MPYRKPPRTTPSCVILWDRQRHIGDVPGYLFATASEAGDFWYNHSKRKRKDAKIQRIEADSKREFLSIIQQLLVEHKMNIEEYTKALKSHDWFYDFSDAYDSPRWTNGHKRHIQLERAAMDLDPDYKIWNKHAPDMYQKKGR